MARKKEKLVFGVGVNDYECKIYEKGRAIKAYSVWKEMLRRCYSDKCQAKNPTYIGCRVADEWLSFSKFNKWYNENYPKHLEDKVSRLDLDKDLLVEGNKVYSPETCVFLPHRVNAFLTNKHSSNTSGCTGVDYRKREKKWRARIQDFEIGERKSLGYFTDIEDASEAYQRARAEQCEKAKAWLRELGYAEHIVEKVR